MPNYAETLVVTPLPTSINTHNPLKINIFFEGFFLWCGEGCVNWLSHGALVATLLIITSDTEIILMGIILGGFHQPPLIK